MVFDRNWSQIADWSIRIVAPFALAFLGMLTSQLNNAASVALENRERITAIEANRYTQQDAYNDRGRLWEQLDEIKSSITDLERRMPSRQEMDTLNESIRDLRMELRK